LGIAWLASRDNEAKGQPAKLPGPRPSPQPPQPSPPSTQGLRGPPGEPMEPVIIQRHGGGGTGPQGTRRPGDLRGATVHFAAGTQGGELENVLYELKKAGLDYNAAVPRSGKIVELMPPSAIAPHAHVAKGAGHSVAGSNNRHTLGLAFLNTGWSPRERPGWIPGPPPPQNVLERALANRVISSTDIDQVWWEPYTVPQLEGAARYLAKVFFEAHVLQPEIWGHGELAGWKADPGPAFPMVRFKRRVQELIEARKLAARKTA